MMAECMFHMERPHREKIVGGGSSMGAGPAGGFDRGFETHLSGRRNRTGQTGAGRGNACRARGTGPLSILGRCSTGDSQKAP